MADPLHDFPRRCVVTVTGGTDEVEASDDHGFAGTRIEVATMTYD